MLCLWAERCRPVPALSWSLEHIEASSGPAFTRTGTGLVCRGLWRGIHASGGPDGKRSVCAAGHGNPSSMAWLAAVALWTHTVALQGATQVSLSILPAEQELAGHAEATGPTAVDISPPGARPHP